VERYTEDLKIWLLSLAHRDLSDKDILKGFIKYYVLCDFGISQVINDIVFHTIYGTAGVMNAQENIIRVLNQTIQNDI
jgi:serine/threonine protein kinase